MFELGEVWSFGFGTCSRQAPDKLHRGTADGLLAVWDLRLVA
ncbi:hypothetical protein [Rhodohalobacter sp.]|nr:hypothetical protein [Rhodohalobacter sp.]